MGGQQKQKQEEKSWLQSQVRKFTPKISLLLFPEKLASISMKLFLEVQF